MRLQSHIILTQTFKLGTLYHKNPRYKENNKSTKLFGNEFGLALYQEARAINCNFEHQVIMLFL